MKRITPILILMLLFAACKKEMVTPCGNDIDTYNFPHQTIRTDTSFIFNNQGDRKVWAELVVYRGRAIICGEYSDTLAANQSHTFLFREMNDTTTSLPFSNLTQYDSIRLLYFPYHKACTGAGWKWTYWGWIPETYLP